MTHTHLLVIEKEFSKRYVRIDSRQRRSDLSLPPAGATAGHRSLWPLGHGVTVDLGPRRWEGSAPCFEGFVLNF
jgi:hypothetical protein